MGCLSPWRSSVRGSGCRLTSGKRVAWRYCMPLYPPAGTARPPFDRSIALLVTIYQPQSVEWDVLGQRTCLRFPSGVRFDLKLSCCLPFWEPLQCATTWNARREDVVIRCGECLRELGPEPGLAWAPPLLCEALSHGAARSLPSANTRFVACASHCKCKSLLWNDRLAQVHSKETFAKHNPRANEESFWAGIRPFSWTQTWDLVQMIPHCNSGTYQKRISLWVSTWNLSSTSNSSL